MSHRSSLSNKSVPQKAGTHGAKSPKKKNIYEKKREKQTVITPPETLSRPPITTFPKKYMIVSVFYTPRLVHMTNLSTFLLPLFTSVQRHTLKSLFEDPESFPRFTLLTLFLPGHLACYFPGPIKIIRSWPHIGARCLD
jgi:hypothetical protein